MTNPTTPFGWQMPTSTDLVTDLPADFETFGQAVATSMTDLLGGTTGQVLAKASNTDMDFSWVAQDDSNAIQNAIVDAKGDLIAATANDTPARLAVGNNGETLVADSSTSTGLRYQGNFAAGKNKVINGDFGIWQRGTSFTSQTFPTYYADRWVGGADGGGTRTISQQTFTPGTAPVAGYEGTFFLRAARSVAGSGSTYDVIEQRVEDVRTFAGQTVTFSFWAKADSSRTFSYSPEQVFGSGGSATVAGTGSNFNLTTSWQRFTHTTTIASISGKTIGTGSYLNLRFYLPVNTTFTIDFWGVQVEGSSVATAFQTATGTLQGELAACQRYYNRNTSVGAFAKFALGYASGTTATNFFVQFPVTMRIAPTAVETTTASLYRIYDGITGTACTGFGVDQGTTQTILVSVGVAAGAVQYRPYTLEGNNSTSAYLGFSAEL